MLTILPFIFFASGYVEPAHFNAFHFENQMRTFHSYGRAIDPTVGSNTTLNKVVTDLQLMPSASKDPDEPTDKSVHKAIQSAVAKQGWWT